MYMPLSLNIIIYLLVSDVLNKNMEHEYFFKIWVLITNI